jgi:hypothetical protein
MFTALRGLCDVRSLTAGSTTIHESFTLTWRPSACEAAEREIQQRRQRADADIRRDSEAWAQKKFGSSTRSLAFAARLHAIAIWTFDSMQALTLAPTLVALQALKRHMARVSLSQNDLTSFLSSETGPSSPFAKSAKIQESHNKMSGIWILSLYHL